MGNLLDRKLFTPPEPTYSASSFPGELCSLGERGPVCLALSAPGATHVVVLLHGNAIDLGGCRQYCTMLRDALNINVLAVEYQGELLRRGKSPRQEDIDEAALAAIRFLRDAGWEENRIVVFGNSLGCGCAVTAAATLTDAAALVLYAPFTSVDALARARVGKLAS
ncbi:unnamed protein product, partial [Phaeothamnion confervicola]